MTSRTYFVWITLLSDAYAEHLVGRLVRRGYNVGPISRQSGHLVLHNDDKPSAIFSVRVTFKFDNDESAKVSNALEEMKDTLEYLKIKYHSLIISEEAVSTWCLGNISIKEIADQIESAKFEVN